jgi:hypothetical protein
MNKETLMSLLRTFLTSFGVFLLGKNLLGAAIDQSVWQMVVGVVMAGVSVVWGIFDKTVGIEMLQSFLRSAIIGFGGLLVARGSLSPEKLESILGIVMSILPLLYSMLSRKKTNNLVNGTLSLEELKK